MSTGKDVKSESFAIAAVSDRTLQVAEATQANAVATNAVAEATQANAVATNAVAEATQANAVATHNASLRQASAINSLTSALAFQGELISNAITLVADELKQKRIQEEFWMLQDRIDSYFEKLNVQTILPILEKYSKPEMLEMNDAELAFLANTIIGKDLQSETMTTAMTNRTSLFLEGLRFLSQHCLVYFVNDCSKLSLYKRYPSRWQEQLYNLQLRGLPTSLNPIKDYRLYVPTKLYVDCDFNAWEPEHYEFMDSITHKRVHAFIKPVIAHGWKTWSGFSIDYVDKLYKSPYRIDTFSFNYSLWENLQKEYNLTISMNNLRNLCCELHQAARMDILSLKGINLQE